MKIKYVFIILVLLTISSVAQSSEDTPSSKPIEIVKQILEQFLIDMKEGHTKACKKSGLCKKMEDVILPYIDKELTSRLVLGKHWRTANVSQRKRFTEGFSSLLIRKYIKAFNEHRYDNVTIKYLPVKKKIEGTKAIVRTIIIISESGEPDVEINYHIDYYLQNNGNEWKIYDVSAEGLRFVLFYRSSFDTRIRKGGIESALRFLEKKNSKK